VLTEIFLSLLISSGKSRLTHLVTTVEIMSMKLDRGKYVEACFLLSILLPMDNPSLPKPCAHTVVIFF
jgi:hypothetical protein